jgi:7-keto-8-aminopelargonate synthetase-like enzyme
MSLSERWSGVLGELRALDRHRELTLPSGVDFSSNDYLGYGAGRLRPLPPLLWYGLPTVPRDVTGGLPGLLETYGQGSGTVGRPCHNEVGRPCHNEVGRSGMASRLLRGQHPIWDEVESALARWHGAETALMFTSGYVANEGLLATVIEPHDWVASDQFNHASVIDGLRLSKAERHIYRHCDLNHLEDGLHEAARRRGPRRELFVVTESLFGMEGDVAPLEDLQRLASRHGAHLIVDEAHATGCLGPDGSGLVDAAGLRGGVLATVHTGGKALGVCGAYVCGSAQLRELLVNRCRQFVFTTALPPAIGAWWLEALVRVAADHQGRDLLHQAARVFRGALAERGVPALGERYIVPVTLGADGRTVNAARRLRTAGWDIRAIRPPTVPIGTARLRISIHADHDRELLLRAAAAIAEVLS